DHSRNERLANAHGWLLTIGLGVLLPLAVLCGRYARKDGAAWWFKAHGILGTAGIAVAVAGVAVIWPHVASEGGDGHYGLTQAPDHDHSRHGFMILLLCVLQLLLGVLRP
ncbi:unnamed protein product, partial [Phaeothamnion confervicola]